ncbi:zinc finger protein 845-like [Palaemon carinicauda]|uniref:zinc finger protein 845-like n=1 Tax=Palaemon carinicauda TaxID=392227 RepID=UPI0035B65809
MEPLKCVVCREKFRSEDQQIFIQASITQLTPLKEIVESALNRELRATDIMCKQCLNLFDEKDRLQKMATDINSHVLNKIKDSSKIVPNGPATISITVGETSANESIREELERQYKNISLGELRDLSSGILNMKETLDSSQVIIKRKRGRPRKSVNRQIGENSGQSKKVNGRHNEENSDRPPLMVHERQKRKRSEKFNTFLEVLKGERDFYIIDEDKEEPKTAKRRGGRKKRILDPNITYVGSYKSEDALNRMCIIQLTDTAGQENLLQTTVKDNGKLNLAEVVEEILGIDSNDETSLINNIDPMGHVEDDLIKVIDFMDTNNVGRTEDDIDLKEFNLNEDELDIKEEQIDWSLDDIGDRQAIKRELIMVNDKKSDQNKKDLPVNQIKKCREPLTSKPSIEVADIEVLNSVVPNLEVTITHSNDDTLHYVVSTHDDLGVVENSLSFDSLVRGKSKEEIQEHLEKFRCKLCQKVFPNKELARLHAQADHKESIPSANDKPYGCGECNRKFPTAKGRDSHVLMHLRYNPVQCEECSLAFNSYRPLERHLRNEHDKDPTLHCNQCEEEFVLGSSLKLHVEIAHQSSNKKNTRLASNVHSRKLMNNVSRKLGPIRKAKKYRLVDKIKSNRLFECPLCQEKIFGIRAIKTHHKKVHDNQEYTCKFCKYKSHCLSTYDRHMVKVHKASTVVLYHCLKCKKGFQDPTDLEEHHLLFHHAEKTFRCRFCGEAFTCVPMLRFHSKTHVAFSCEVCHLGFMKEEALEEHTKNVHTSDHTFSSADVSSRDAGKENKKGTLKSGKESDPESQNDNSGVDSRVLEIGCDGTVNVKEESKVESESTIIPSEDVTLHLQQTREGGLEEMDMLNPLRGHKVKDLPKKMNCPVCNKVLTTKFLKTHMLSHKGELPHKCNVCGKAYAQGTLLRKHMKNRHYEEFLKMGNKNPKKHKVSCEYCDSIYDDIYALEDHLWKHISVKTYECADCKIKFGMESNLREHYKSHYFKEGQFCPICKREFKSIGYYNEHVEKCQNRWKCEQCGLECFSQGYYKKHQRAEHGGENTVRYQCNLCEKSFIERHRYDDHLITHSSERAYSCLICEKQFKRQRPLNDHILRCHSGNQLTCSYCRKQFSTQQELVAHKKTHRREYPCNSCGHVYMSKESLTNHLMVNHCETNPHSCNICGQSFVKQANLKAHMVTHNANTPNICPVDDCHKMFRTEAILRNHVARRHNELSYLCPICDRKFGLESDQIRHMTTHTKGTSFPCLICGNNFKTEASLDRHVLIHTQEKPYECGICQHTSFSRQQIIRHIHSEHGILDYLSHIVVKRWRCSGCGKMFVVRTSLLRHLEEHAAHGVNAEGFAVKTTSSASAGADGTTVISSESAATTSAFIDQMSTLSWDDITTLLRLHIFTDKAAADGKTLAAADVWQCPGCLLATQREDEMRDHLISTPLCQEAVILQMADGLQNADEVEENNPGEQGSSGERVGNGNVLQLTSNEGELQYVIVQEEESTAKLSKEMIKVEHEENEEGESMPILVNMDESIQQLLQQPGHGDIQIVVENSTPLKHLLEDSQDQDEQNDGVVHASSSIVQDNLPDSTTILNGSEVLLQTADGQLLLQQTVGGVTQYQLVEGVPTGSEEEESSLTLIQSSPTTLPAGEFIEELQSQCM